MASEASKRVSRSLSGDLDSDGEFVDEGNGEHSNQPGKPGRKKNPNSQAARRDQNRIAQREFRLRKQQRIRDLEARVEILSGSKDETYVQMRDIINELIAENQTLRNMVRGLSGFIGEGAGGFLPRMGWTLKEFEAFINKADTDTAFEAFAKRKRAMQDGGLLPPGGAAATTTSSSSSEKRGAPDDVDAARKRARTAAGNGVFDGDVSFSSAAGPFGQPFGGGGGSGGGGAGDAPAMELYSSMRAPAGFPAGFLSGLGAEQQQQQQQPSAFLAPGLGFENGAREAFPPAPSFAGGRSAAAAAAGGGGAPLQSMAYLGAAAAAAGTPPRPASEPGAGAAPVEDELLDDPKAQEARKLVGYHLDNYRRNSAYCLPPSLRPTLVQRTVEHEGIIDGIVHPELRNRMILLRGRFNLADCIHSYLTSTIIHGDDVLGHANWEIQENWLKKYGYLVDPTTLSLTNRWRKERGEPEISMSEIAPSEQLPGLSQS